jgi:ethanolaminephosphotransferase
MIPKQKEMDDMVRTIYTAIENEDHLANTLFVICGDHGMNDGGNHGGSSPGETSPALVFMSPKLIKITKKTKRESPVSPKHEGEFEYYRMVEQSDIAPTLAGLLGFPVPKNNLGVFLEEFLGFWDSCKCSLSMGRHRANECRVGSIAPDVFECEADEDDCGSHIPEPTL